MARNVKVGLIQAANPINDESVPVAEVQEAMFQKHLPLIEQAGEAAAIDFVMEKLRAMLGSEVTRMAQRLLMST